MNINKATCRTERLTVASQSTRLPVHSGGIRFQRLLVCYIDTRELRLCESFRALETQANSVGLCTPIILFRFFGFKILI